MDIELEPDFWQTIDRSSFIVAYKKWVRHQQEALQIQAESVADALAEWQYEQRSRRPR
jgi:hypothetical protein